MVRPSVGDIDPDAAYNLVRGIGAEMRAKRGELTDNVTLGAMDDWSCPGPDWSPPSEAAGLAVAAAIVERHYGSMRYSDWFTALRNSLEAADAAKMMVNRCRQRRRESVLAPADDVACYIRDERRWRALAIVLERHTTVWSTLCAAAACGYDGFMPYVHGVLSGMCPDWRNLPAAAPTNHEAKGEFLRSAHERSVAHPLKPS